MDIRVLLISGDTTKVIVDFLPSIKFSRRKLDPFFLELSRDANMNQLIKLDTHELQYLCQFFRCPTTQLKFTF